MAENKQERPYDTVCPHCGREGYSNHLCPCLYPSSTKDDRIAIALERIAEALERPKPTQISKDHPNYCAPDEIYKRMLELKEELKRKGDGDVIGARFPVEMKEAKGPMFRDAIMPEGDDDKQ